LNAAEISQEELHFLVVIIMQLHFVTSSPQQGGFVLQFSVAHNLLISLYMPFLMEGILMSISAQGYQIYLGIKWGKTVHIAYLNLRYLILNLCPRNTSDKLTRSLSSILEH
jgi:hypothetical protein